MSTEIDGGKGRLKLHRWGGDDPTFVAVIVHGLAEHAGRYNHVAQALVDNGARSTPSTTTATARPRARRASSRTSSCSWTTRPASSSSPRSENPGLPVVMVGHSLGGLIATRYAQRPDHGLTALVLSAPAVGANPDLIGLLELEEFPEVPIDPSVLSRDPAVGEAYVADPLVYSGPLQKQTLLSLGGSIRAVAEGPDFGGLPTLWLHGTEDFLVPIESARPLVEMVGGDALEQKSYEGARHEIFNETNQDEVIADAVAFLARTLDRASDPA